MEDDTLRELLDSVSKTVSGPTIGVLLILTALISTLVRSGALKTREVERMLDELDRIVGEMDEPDDVNRDIWVSMLYRLRRDLGLGETET